jgi:D-ribose pyranose/furanose isomerase RbsD
MKHNGMLNCHISKVLPDLGHTDKIMIADAGHPVPAGSLTFPDVALMYKGQVPRNGLITKIFLEVEIGMIK